MVPPKQTRDLQSRSRPLLVAIVVAGIAAIISCGGSNETATPSLSTPSTASPETSGAPISREEAMDLLGRATLQLEDLPQGFSEAGAAFNTLDEQAMLGGSENSDKLRRRLQDTGFVLGYSRFYRRDSPEGLVFVGAQFLLFDSQAGALATLEDIFRNPGAFPSPRSVPLDHLDDFPQLGDGSRAYFSPTGGLPSGVRLSGSSSVEGYVVYIRVGLLVARLGTISRAHATEQEAVDIAKKFASRIEAQLR